MESVDIRDQSLFVVSLHVSMPVFWQYWYSLNVVGSVPGSSEGGIVSSAGADHDRVTSPLSGPAVALKPGAPAVADTWSDMAPLVLPATARMRNLYSVLLVRFSTS